MKIQAYIPYVFNSQIKKWGIGICFLFFSQLELHAEQKDSAWMQALNFSTDSSFTYKLSTHAFSVGGGGSYLYNTYFSPLHYKGWQADVVYEGYKEKSTKKSIDLAQQWFVHIYGGQVNPYNQTANALSLHLQAFWALYGKWKLLDPLHLHLGGLASFSAGGFYNARNGNNPAVIDVALDLQLSYMLTYYFKIKKQVFSLRHRLSIPLLGVTFAPPYGASYYEMFMVGLPPSDYIAFTFFHNTFKMQHQLSLDFYLPHAILRLTYLEQSQWRTIHQIQQRNHFHSLQFGVVYNLINVSGSKAVKPANLPADFYL
ncbi:MAG: DUF3316 domain-containing protein [Bacteroidales bacterium]